EQTRAPTKYLDDRSGVGPLKAIGRCERLRERGRFQQLSAFGRVARPPCLLDRGEPLVDCPRRALVELLDRPYEEPVDVVLALQCREQPPAKKTDERTAHKGDRRPEWEPARPRVVRDLGTEVMRQRNERLAELIDEPARIGLTQRGSYFAVRPRRDPSRHAPSRGSAARSSGSAPFVAGRMPRIRIARSTPALRHSSRPARPRGTSSARTRCSRSARRRAHRASRRP